MRAPRLCCSIVLGSLTLAAVVAPRLAAADGSFRCGSRIVRDGETQDDVSVKCGAPDAQREWTEVQTESVYEGNRKLERSVPIQYAEWKYDFGRDRLIRYLLFVQGRLREVRTGPYGHR